MHVLASSTVLKKSYRKDKQTLKCMKWFPNNIFIFLDSSDCIPVQHPCNPKVPKLHSPIFCQKYVLQKDRMNTIIIFNGVNEEHKRSKKSTVVWFMAPVIWCPYEGFFYHGCALVLSKSAQTNPGSRGEEILKINGLKVTFFTHHLFCITFYTL